MTTLQVAHQLGFVWVVRLDDGEVATLDPPDAPKYTKRVLRSKVEQSHRSLPYDNIFPAYDSPDLANHHWDPRTLMDDQGIRTETMPDLDYTQPFETFTQTSDVDTNITTHTPFTFFDIPQDGLVDQDGEQPDPDHSSSSTSPGPLNITHLNQQKRNRSVVRDNALLVTQVCINLGLNETSPMLKDQAVQDALYDLVQRTRPGQLGAATSHPIPLCHLDCAYPAVLQILLNSSHLIRRTLDHLHSLSIPSWKISLAFSHSAQRDLLCESMLQPGGLETAFTDPILPYFQAWETDIQPHLDRLDRILVDIYGEPSVKPIIVRLREEQAAKVYDGSKGGGGGRGPLLIRLVDVCRMWNDTIASYKVQKMLFSEGLESCE